MSYQQLTLQPDLDVMMEVGNGGTVVQIQINVKKAKETVTAMQIVLAI